ncbi:uncharacterized protein PHALS_10264 [Plasmopara halstedii]|uniref:Uncharacterized protein n=1 Tax=Plasmopara halstedii TaxID=4781 RepID=A0A0P1AHR2_PLAHL|nr:uncharacterized protein PHALS_10264 [Plasmopara halstedii]CEG40042.1 hypothetical protein PHALS_10264 [Plasmopara halstedii]|eukprot:XP_024576411.1 hypothetical protein PHALS_10264 [Plasmopara halstedii]
MCELTIKEVKQFRTVDLRDFAYPDGQNAMPRIRSTYRDIHISSLVSSRAIATLSPRHPRYQ